VTPCARLHACPHLAHQFEVVRHREDMSGVCDDQRCHRRHREPCDGGRSRNLSPAPPPPGPEKDSTPAEKISCWRLSNLPNCAWPLPVRTASASLCHVG